MKAKRYSYKKYQEGRKGGVGRQEEKAVRFSQINNHKVGKW